MRREKIIVLFSIISGVISAFVAFLVGVPSVRVLTFALEVFCVIFLGIVIGVFIIDKLPSLEAKIIRPAELTILLGLAALAAAVPAAALILAATAILAEVMMWILITVSLGVLVVAAGVAGENFLSQLRCKYLKT